MLRAIYDHVRVYNDDDIVSPIISPSSKASDNFIVRTSGIIPFEHETRKHSRNGYSA